jgi:hypothetical protein
MPFVHGGQYAGFYLILRSKNTKCQSALTLEDKFFYETSLQGVYQKFCLIKVL